MTAKTATTRTATTKETKMTKTAAPASDPKPSVKKQTRKEKAAETVVPEKTAAQKQRLVSTALGAVTRAIKAAEAVEVTDDDRTLDRANHLWEKVATAKQTANARAREAGVAEPFPGDQAVFKPITRPEPEPEHGQIAQDVLDEITKSDKGTRKPATEKPAAPATFEITLVNMTDGSVQGHKAGCADLTRRRRTKVRQANEPWTFSVTSKHDAWTEYNSDFLAEGPESGNYQIDWLPCADEVPQGADDTYEQYLLDEAGEEPEPEPKEPFKATAPKSRKAATTTKAGKETKKVSGTTTAKEKAAPKPKKEVPTPESRNALKAQALVDVAGSLGWKTTTQPNGEHGIRVTIQRGEDDTFEELGCVFVDGKLGLEPDERPYYKSAQRPRPVLLRNVSAMRQQMDADETKRPLARETTRVIRTERADRPRKSFTWDDELSDQELLEAFQPEWAGKRIEWRVQSIGDERFEVVVGKVAKVERVKVTGDRVVSFYTLEYSEKDKGLKSGAMRTVTLKSILRLI